MDQPKFSWTGANIAIMTDMMGKGCSASEVGIVLGTSRNSVIGKATRLDIDRKRNRNPVQGSIDHLRAPKYLNRVGIQKARRERDAAGIAPTAQPYTPQIESGTPPAPLRLSLVDLTDKTCRWPIGDLQWESFHFCGVEPTHGPYCTHHAKMAYQPRRDENARKAVSVGRIVR
jgi:GcrA cell cycle regulator